MLTKRDLRWTQKLFSVYSKLMLVPVTFKPIMLVWGGGQIESGEITISRKIGFKIAQILFACQTFFLFYRTLEYVIVGDGGFFSEESDKENVNFDWDFFPVMLIWTAGYVTWGTAPYFIFESVRELNIKVFNETIKLRGKII